MIPAASIIPLLISFLSAFFFWRGWKNEEVLVILRRHWWSWEFGWRHAHRDEDPREYHANMWMLGGCSVFFLFVAWLEA